MKAHTLLFYLIVVEEFSTYTCVLTDDEVDFSQDSDSTVGDIFEVSYRCRDNIEHLLSSYTLSVLTSDSVWLDYVLTCTHQLISFSEILKHFFVVGYLIKKCL